MPSDTPFDPTYPLAPSELVLLKGDQFAKKVMLGNIRLLHTDASVSVSQLGEAVLAAAILASEQAGGLRLELRQKKAMFGLRKVQVLYAVPTGAEIPWPDHSLEAQVCPIAKRLQPDGSGDEVSNILYAYLRQDSGSPWQSALELVMQGMAARGVLDAVEKKTLKVFTTTDYRLPENTAVLAAKQPIEPLQGLLRACERERPEVWQGLVKELKSAVKARTEENNSSSEDF